MWIDSDAWLANDVQHVLQQQQTQHSAFVFWRDIVQIGTINPIWKLMGIEPVAGVGCESGVLVVDKTLGGRALFLAALMNQWQDVFYCFIHGDKDTFLVACEKLGVPYTVVPFVPAIIDGVGFLQPDLDGEPLAAHVTWCHKNVIHNRLKTGNTIFGEFKFIDPNNAHIVNNLLKKKRHVVVDHRTPNPASFDVDAACVLGDNALQLHKEVFQQALLFFNEWK